MESTQTSYIDHNSALPLLIDLRQSFDLLNANIS